MFQHSILPFLFSIFIVTIKSQDMSSGVFRSTRFRTKTNHLYHQLIGASNRACHSMDSFQQIPEECLYGSKGSQSIRTFAQVESIFKSNEVKFILIVLKYLLIVFSSTYRN